MMDDAQPLEFGWGTRTNVYEFVEAPDPSHGGPGPFDLSVNDTHGNRSAFEQDPDGLCWLAQLAVPIESLDELERPWATAPSLFRKFGDLASIDDGPHSLDAILEFANEYGWLGLPRYVAGPAGPGHSSRGNADLNSSVRKWPKLCYEMDISVNGKPYWGESLHAWLMEIQNLSIAIRWRDAVKNLDHQGFLKSLYERLPNNYLSRFRQQNYWELVPQGRIPQLLVVQSQPVYSIEDKEQWRSAANAGLKRLINEKLRLHTSAIVQLDSAESEFSIAATPHNQIGVMWIQLATEVSRNQDYGVCENCRSWFLRDDPSNNRSRRKDARYCSSSCVEKMSRRRRQIASDRGVGKSWKEISRDTGLPEAKVKALHQEYAENQRRRDSRNRQSKKNDKN